MIPRMALAFLYLVAVFMDKLLAIGISKIT